MADIVVGENSPYFDGHFPGFKILPAVAQVDVILKAAERDIGGIFKKSIVVEEVKRMKFAAFVRPGTTLRPDLHYDAENRTLSFKLLDANTSRAYASGSFIIKHV